ncbi:MAG: hypothetical protein ACI88G_000290 [Woeseiaceae bacterium]
MKRWIVVLLIALAVIVLVSPGIVGRLAEKNIEESINWADDENPTVSVTTERFDRGWFSSEGHYRIVFEGGALREARELYTAETGNADLPALLIDTRIDHGLLPISSLARDSGTLAPGLASTRSTFELDDGSGEPVALPGVLHTNFGLSGASESRFLLEPGSFDGNAWDADWQGADLTFSTDTSSGAISVAGNTQSFSISQVGEKVVFGAMTVDVDQVRSEYGINVGRAEVEIDGLQVESMVSPFGIGTVFLNAENSIRNQRMNAHSEFSIDAITIPNFGEMDLTTELTIERFDAAPLSVITEAFKEAQASDNPDLALQMLYPEIEGDMQELIAAGGMIRFDQFDITLPQGTLETVVDLTFATLDDDEAFSWPAVLLAMTAKIDMRMPAPLYEFIQMMNPEAGSLVAMGVLVRDGDDYVMDAEYAQGLLNVNGAPMPVPMPGM